MRLTKHLFGFALTAIAAGALVSCTNELNDAGLRDPNKLGLAKTPDVVAWSGNHTFNNFSTTSIGTRTVATRTQPVDETLEVGEQLGGDDVVTWKKCYTKALDKSSEAEWIGGTLVEGKTYDPEEVNEIYDSFLYYAPGDEDLTFHIYPVYRDTGTEQNILLGIFYYDEKGEKIIEHVIHTFVDKLASDCWTDNNTKCEGREVTVKGGTKFGFFWKGNCWIYASYDYWSGLESKFDQKFYTSAKLNFETFHQDDYDKGGSLAYEEYTPRKIRAVSVYGNETKTYLGFEDGVDFDCNDAVFTCPETLVMVSDENTVPGVPDDPKGDDELCPVPGCGHPKHDGENCDQCDEGTTCNPNPENPNCPVEGCGHPKHPGKDCEQCPEGSTCHPKHETVKKGVTKSEVEVNLSVNDVHKDKNGNQKYNVADLVAKLSIHIRHAGDVEIFIPIENKYCLNDDLYIFNTHDVNLVHGGIDHSVAWEIIPDHYVTLNFNWASDGITIWTEGMDAEVFQYCAENFGDGLNFEAYIYLNEAIDFDENDFKEMLDSSTIKFLDGVYPDYYINAFNDTEDNPQGEKDCTVTIVNEQKNLYPSHKTDTHLNGSEYNDIWKSTACQGPDGHHDHYFLWKYAAEEEAAQGSGAASGGTGTGTGGDTN